jgi:hypothetical protein
MSIKLAGLETGTNNGQFAGGYFSYDRFTADATGTCREIRIYANNSGHVKVAIYDSGGNRIAKQDTSTAVTSGQWNTIPLEATCSITSGQTYYLSYICDASIMAYHSYISGVYHGYKSATYSTFTFPNPMGSGFTINTTQWGFITAYSIDTYNEAGKLVVGKGTQGIISTPMTLSELSKLINVSVLAGQQSLSTFLETAKLQVVLVMQGEFDSPVSVIDETGKLQVILCTQSELDSRILNELDNPIIIIVEQGQSGSTIFSELSKSLTILAAITSTDVMLFDETGEDKLQIVLSIIGQTGILLFPELGKLQTIIVKTGAHDQFVATYMSGGILQFPLIKFPRITYPVYGVKSKKSQ